MITSTVLARLIAGLISVIQASNLRNRVYSQQNRIDTLELAIEDILRISRSTVSEDQRLKLIENICTRVEGSTEQ